MRFAVGESHMDVLVQASGLGVGDQAQRTLSGDGDRQIAVDGRQRLVPQRIFTGEHEARLGQTEEGTHEHILTNARRTAAAATAGIPATGPKDACWTGT
ncbi:hypothetical protein [Streptomyces sp. NPDC053069]|uniref:hypothetical protein n=1 Tax=Streptomyces sp. NPDC053069 TaxID=3365695 RepID=UPI0037D18E19